VPARRELQALRDRLEWAREAALETVRWVKDLPFPDFERDYEFVALQHPAEYPFNEGRLRSSSGLDLAVAEFEKHFSEEHQAHSSALVAALAKRGAYCVGPLARYNLNFDRLSPLARQAAREAGLGPSCRNPFKSIVVRAVETLYATDEALRILDAYEPPDAPAVPVTPHAGAGCACTEAPRGILYHRYRVGEDGTLQEARIVPPTSQNQRIIAEDLREFVARHPEPDERKLTWQCERVIRNHDPCISCATHFLKLTLERG
jgi:coenzyme F420-reducing hydrogenase alpha subunit